ncbi:MAG: Rrf2 family transcriptional regulator [Gemmobacter sp.]|nr:Rrf2 family transcriptional regulator [Gemmobacter sp.]
MQKVDFMRLTTKTNLAARTLMACAVNDGITLRSAEIAHACNASLNHLLQVVNALQAHGFVETIRGRNGGLRLARPPAQISIGEVFRIFEAGVPFAECFAPDTNTCPLSSTCRLRGYVSRAVEAFYHELDMVTLADLTKGNCGLIALLEVPDSLRARCSVAANA